MAASSERRELGEATRSALKRSARKAREIARRFGTPVYISRDGKIVALKPS